MTHQLHFIRKHSITVFSLMLFILFLSLILIQENCSYDDAGWCWKYWDALGHIGNSLMIAVPFFIFSILSLLVSSDLSRGWKRFALWWVPLSILAILLAPDHGGGMLYPSLQDMLSILLPALFIFISIGMFVRARYLEKNTRAPARAFKGAGIVLLSIVAGLGLLWFVGGLL